MNYSHFKTFCLIPFLATLFLACSDSTLTRGKAEQMITSELILPKDVIFTQCTMKAEVSLDPKFAHRIKFMNYYFGKLAEEGLITFKKSNSGQSGFLQYNAEFTDKGAKYTFGEPITDRNGTVTSSVKTGKMKFGEITGILESKTENTAAAEFTVALDNSTPFGKLFLIMDDTQKAKVRFTKYDDGWRIDKTNIPTPQNYLEIGEEGILPESIANDSRDRIDQLPEEAMVISEAETRSQGASTARSIIITGSNVRLRSEPDVSKENIIHMMDKGIKAQYVSETLVAGIKWYKIKVEDKSGWVSSQFASLESGSGSSSSLAEFMGVWSGESDLLVEVKNVNNRIRVRLCYGADATSGTEYLTNYKDNKLIAVGIKEDFYKFELPTLSILTNGKLQYNSGVGPYELSKSTLVMPAIEYKPPFNDD